MKVDFNKAMKTIQTAIPSFIGIVFGLTIGAVVVGVLLQQVTSGNIQVVSGISTFLTNWTTTVVSFFTTFGTAISVTIALLIVVVIVVLFGKYMSGGGKGDRS
jgi:hypothetical protein